MMRWLTFSLTISFFAIGIGAVILISWIANEYSNRFGEGHRIKGLPEVTGIITTDTPIYAPFRRMPCYALQIDVSYSCKKRKRNSDGYSFLADNLKMKIGEKYYPIAFPKGYKYIVGSARRYTYFPDIQEGKTVIYDRSDDIHAGLFGRDERLDCLVKTKDCFSRDINSITIRESFCRLDREVTLKGKIQGDSVILLK